MKHKQIRNNSAVSIIFLFVFSFICFGQGEKANEPNIPEVGKEFSFVFQGHKILLVVPLDYNDMNEAAVIIYYGGDTPDTSFFRYVTGSRGAIILGMTYANEPKPPVTEGKYVNYIKGEVKRVGQLIKYLEKEFRLRIDEDRLIITGRSKGGWLTNDIFEYRPQPWVGAAIVSAGRHGIVEAASQKSFEGKPVYVGAGEFDGNMKAARRARNFLRRMGADVTFEMYEGLGHAMNQESVVFRKWIRDRIDGR